MFNEKEIDRLLKILSNKDVIKAHDLIINSYKEKENNENHIRKEVD